MFFGQRFIEGPIVKHRTRHNGIWMQPERRDVARIGRVYVTARRLSFALELISQNNRPISSAKDPALGIFAKHTQNRPGKPGSASLAGHYVHAFPPTAA